MSPNNLDYHTLCDEVWILCYDLYVKSTKPAHFDVISASNPTGDIPTNILLKERALREDLSSSVYLVMGPNLRYVG